jgi:glycerophosphoryl diester phosphodiesterase
MRMHTRLQLHARMPSDRLRLAPGMVPAIIAHRGSWSRHRENTLPAFEAALAEGADMVELDVWLSADGRPMVHHDQAISPGVAIGTLSQAQLAADAPYVPTLDAVFQWARDRIGVYVELKGPGTPWPVVDLVRTHAVAQQVVVGSFVAELVAGVREADPTLRTSVLFHTTHVDAALELGRRLGVDFVHPCWKTVSERPSDVLDEAAIARIKRAGFGIVTWDEDRPEVLQALLQREGIEGMCTNRPERLARLRQRATRHPASD